MLHQIGVGALGPVFRTYEPARDRLVAVKAFRMDITPEQAQSLADELSRAAEASLFHPSIVEPIAGGIEGTLAYRAEEYVAAESLDVAMRHYAPATVDKALPFITQLAGAIDFARVAGVGHGALHPRDIFVTPDEARATGFGVVEALERVGLRAPVRRPYSAPERVEGAHWDTTADVFSLAAIAFELLTGRRPSGTGREIGPLGGNLPHAEAIQQVLARAMSEDARDRYPTALGFVSALESAASGEGITGAIAAGPFAVGSAAALTPESAREAEVTDFTLRRSGDKAEESTPSSQPASSLDAGEEGPMDRLAHPADDEGELSNDVAAAAAFDRSDEVREPARVADELPLRISEPAEEDALLHEYSSEPAAARPPARDYAREAADKGLIHYPREIPAQEEPVREQEDESPADEDEMIAGRPRESLVEQPLEPVLGNSGDRAAAGLFREYSHDPVAESPREEGSRRPPSVLLLALTLVLGLLLGFAAGYSVGGRNARSAEPPETVSRPEKTGAGQPAGREFSEETIKAAPKQQAAQPPSTAPPVPSEGAGRAAAARERGPEAKEPVAATNGTLVVRSTPPGAGVTLNGRWRGRTPVTLERLPFGRYIVRVVHPGYAVERQEVALSRGSASRALSLRLRALRPAGAARASAPVDEERSSAAMTGSISVASNPTGARIFIDGKPVGTAPVRVPEVRIGAHVVRMELPDHRTWSTSARVVSGQDTRVTGSLERIR